MALSTGYYGKQAVSLWRQRCQLQFRSSVLASRSFSFQVPPRSTGFQHKIPSSWRPPRSRVSANTCRPLASHDQPAPSAQAYLASGVIKGTSDLVNVKKVLVIGSGGLSIGQAGEFDYSGTCCRYPNSCSCLCGPSLFLGVPLDISRSDVFLSWPLRL